MPTQSQGSAAVFISSYPSLEVLFATVESISEHSPSLIREIFICERPDLPIPKERIGPKIEVYRPSRDLNSGAVKKVGFRHVLQQGFAYLVVWEANGPLAGEAVARMLNALIEGNHDIVMGIRPRAANRWLGNAALHILLKVSVGMRFSDFLSPYRVYRTDCLRRIPFLLNSEQPLFDSEVLIQFRTLQASFGEVALSESVRLPRVALNWISALWQTLILVVSYRLHQLGVFFEKRFELIGGVHYTLKASRYSSHGQVVALVRPGSEVLDVGCGTGLLSQRLSDKGVKSLGIDYELKENVWGGFETYIQDDLEAADKLPADRTFDYVILADVLEHLRTPSQLLQKVRPLLGTNGKLIASTGNVALWYMRLSLLAGRFNYGKRGILDETHVRLYTLRSFQQLIQQAGFKIENLVVTGLPFELVFRSTGKSYLLKLVDWTYYQLARFWPKLFAYQFVIEAVSDGLDVSSHSRPEV